MSIEGLVAISSISIGICVATAIATATNSTSNSPAALLEKEEKQIEFSKKKNESFEKMIELSKQHRKKIEKLKFIKKFIDEIPDLSYNETKNLTNKWGNIYLEWNDE
jgi:hypothetical protein